MATIPASELIPGDVIRARPGMIEFADSIYAALTVVDVVPSLKENPEPDPETGLHPMNVPDPDGPVGITTSTESPVDGQPMEIFFVWPAALPVDVIEKAARPPVDEVE